MVYENFTTAASISPASEMHFCKNNKKDYWYLSTCAAGGKADSCASYRGKIGSHRKESLKMEELDSIPSLSE